VVVEQLDGSLAGRCLAENVAGLHVAMNKPTLVQELQAAKQLDNPLAFLFEIGTLKSCAERSPVNVLHCGNCEPSFGWDVEVEISDEVRMIENGRETELLPQCVQSLIGFSE
jgi:hypothetical protein